MNDLKNKKKENFVNKNIPNGMSMGLKMQRQFLWRKL